ncbi:MAG: 2-oxoglutarate and iron-dependent oxygenase domain-containing protein, partial [Sphingobium phenoxybenzoativorans]
MPQSILDTIPTLSMANSGKADFAQALGESFHRFGFAMVRDHGMDRALIADGWEKAKAFFALPEAVKQA